MKWNNILQYVKSAIYVTICDSRAICVAIYQSCTICVAICSSTCSYFLLKYVYTYLAIGTGNLFFIILFSSWSPSCNCRVDAGDLILCIDLFVRLTDILYFI